MTFAQHLPVGVKRSQTAVPRHPERLKHKSQKTNLFDRVVFINVGTDVPNVDAGRQELTAHAH